MTLLETIIQELSSVPEPLLIEVLNFIQSAKNDRLLVSESSTPRIPNLHQGEIGIGDDFIETMAENIEDYCLNKVMDESKTTPLLSRDQAIDFLAEEDD